MENLIIKKVLDFTCSKTKKGVEKYPRDKRQELDLLIYIEDSLDAKRLSGGFKVKKMNALFKTLEWKSISCHCGGLSTVLYCDATASILLKNILNKELNI